MERLSIESIKYLKSSLHVGTLPIMANDIIKAFDELIEYKKLEEQNRLLKLESQVKDSQPEEEAEDNFMDALNGTAVEVWEESEVEEDDGERSN